MSLPTAFFSRIAFVIAVAALAACGPSPTPKTEAAPTPAATQAPTPAPDLKAVASIMTHAAMIKPGDKVLITGSIRDNQLQEDLAIEAMKAGGQPLISLSSEQLRRRSYDEVPASFDAQPQTLDLALVSVIDVQLSVDDGESEGIMNGVPPARIAERARLSQPVSETYLKRGVRAVSLGNGLYPTAVLAKRLGKSQAEVAAIFWRAAMVSPDSIRSKGEEVRRALATGKQVRLTSANGTDIRFGVVAERGFVSDGAINADKIKQGHAATQTWLPAGELLMPAAPGTAEGKVVIDRLIIQGNVVEALTLEFSKGKLASMSAKAGLDALKALYDAASGGKDQFSYIDLGLNPEVALPTNTGRVVWMAAGNVTIGVGDNTGWGGNNISNFSLPAAVSGATLAVDGKVLVEGGTLQ